MNKILIIDSNYQNLFNNKNKGKENLYKVYSKSGELITNFVVERADWYVEKGLAEKKSDEPMSIKLLVEFKIGNHDTKL